MRGGPIVRTRKFEREKGLLYEIGTRGQPCKSCLKIIQKRKSWYSVLTAFMCVSVANFFLLNPLFLADNVAYAIAAALHGGVQLESMRSDLSNQYDYDDDV